jgi:CRISPR-associated protein Cas2
MSQHYVICYDVTDDKRRYRIDRVLQGYGERIQLSVFECCLNQSELHRLRLSLKSLIDIEDKINYYPICCHCKCRRHIQGAASLFEQESYIIS